MALSLPNNPDLERFRRDARRLHRGVRSADEHALELVVKHHSEGAAAELSGFTLSDAQLVVARSYGFSSWPGLRHYLDIAEPLRRDPTKSPTSEDPVDAYCDLACLQFSQADDPHRWLQARALLADNPELSARSVYAAATAGDRGAVAAHLAADPSLAHREGGPFRWSPLAYLVYSRVPQDDTVGTARLLLDHGADPDTGYLWQGLPPPFTALTGCFGEGEQGPGRSPRHPAGMPLARLLLERGAEPNDGQTLYNRMFNRDDGHLSLLFEYGLGTGDGGVWRHRLGDALESVEEMMGRQVRWARSHGFTDRLALLAEHGFVPKRAGSRGFRAPSIHRAGSVAAVADVVGLGADVDEAQGGRTALHHFAWIGDVEMVQALVDAGANPDVVDATHGTTPLGWAEYGRQPATAALLRPLTAPLSVE